MLSRIAALCCSALLAACGGGDTTPLVPVASPAAGMWTGSTVNDPGGNRALTGFVLDDGAAWIFYAAPNAPTTFSGVIQGNSTAQAGNFASTDARDFNFDGLGVRSPTLAGSYQTRQSLSWTATYTTGVTNNSTAYRAAADEPQALAVAAGTFNGTGAFPAQTKVATVFDLSAAGTLTGSTVAGCSFVGSRQARTGSGVYNVTVTLGPAPCAPANTTLSGIAFFDAGVNRLYLAATDATRSAALLFVGAKP